MLQSLCRLATEAIAISLLAQLLMEPANKRRCRHAGMDSIILYVSIFITYIYIYMIQDILTWHGLTHDTVWHVTRNDTWHGGTRDTVWHVTRFDTWHGMTRDTVWHVTRNDMWHGLTRDTEWHVTGIDTWHGMTRDTDWHVTRIDTWHGDMVWHVTRFDTRHAATHDTVWQVTRFDMQLKACLITFDVWHALTRNMLWHVSRVDMWHVGTCWDALIFIFRCFDTGNPVTCTKISTNDKNIYKIVVRVKPCQNVSKDT